MMQCRNEWSRIEKTNPTYLDEWYHTVMEKVDAEIDILKRKYRKSHVKKVLNRKEIKEELERLGEICFCPDRQSKQQHLHRM